MSARVKKGPRQPRRWRTGAHVGELRGGLDWSRCTVHLVQLCAAFHYGGNADGRTKRQLCAARGRGPCRVRAPSGGFGAGQALVIAPARVEPCGVTPPVPRWRPLIDGSRRAEQGRLGGEPGDALTGRAVPATVRRAHCRPAGRVPLDGALTSPFWCDWIPTRLPTRCCHGFGRDGCRGARGRAGSRPLRPVRPRLRRDQRGHLGSPTTGCDSTSCRAAPRDLQAQLVRRGQHRGASIPDLILAAIADIEQLVILHYDHDFDIIADVSTKPTEWVVPRGSVG